MRWWVSCNKNTRISDEAYNIEPWENLFLYINAPTTSVIADSSEEAINQAKNLLCNFIRSTGLQFAEKDGKLLVYSSLHHEQQLASTYYDNFQAVRVYSLISADGKSYDSSTPGKLGGHKRLKIYGRLDCPSALRYLAKGQYAQHRVFFADEETAIAAGYRPCGVCMKTAYKEWKYKQQLEKIEK